MEQRKELLEAALRGEFSFTELCRRFGISRKNGYKWLNRYRDQLAFPNQGMSFADRSRRPQRSPTAISAEVEAAIVELRRQRPHCDPNKASRVLAKQSPELALPSESTFAAVLKRHGLVTVRPRRKRASTPYTTPLDHASKPNAVWAIDFKGDFAVGHTRCYPLTVTDSYSRFIIACVALPNTRTQTVKRALRRIFDEYGLPEAIRSDRHELTPLACAVVYAEEGVVQWARGSRSFPRLIPRDNMEVPGASIAHEFFDRGVLDARTRPGHARAWLPKHESHR